MERGALARLWRIIVRALGNLASIAAISPGLLPRLVQGAVLAVSARATAVTDGLRAYAPFSYVIGGPMAVLLAAYVSRFLTSVTRRKSDGAVESNAKTLLNGVPPISSNIESDNSFRQNLKVMFDYHFNQEKRMHEKMDELKKSC